VLVQVEPGPTPEAVADPIRRWKRLGLHPRADGGDPDRQADRHLGRQIGMFLVILAIVSAAIVAFIIYTLTWARSARSRCSS
jgi:putative ABC transport system permease protein